jgi:Icc-related predicted phosphoesterase
VRAEASVAPATEYRLTLCFLAVTDALWMPLWRNLVKTPTWYCEIDGDSVGEPQNLVDLPVQRDGFTRFVFFSDTHSKHELIGTLRRQQESYTSPDSLCFSADIPDGDVLCHTGDVFLRGSKGRCCCRDVRAVSSFFKRQPHATKILVGGNHDRALEALGTPGVEEHFGPNMRYLQHSGTACEGFSVYGTPFSRPSGSGNRAFQSDAAPLDTCSPGVHVLLSHSKLTDVDLRRLRPRVHAYGHFHEGYGMKVKRLDGHTVLCINASICDDKYRAIRRPIVVDIRLAK